MLQMREIRGAAAGAAVIAIYMAMVLMSGRVDPAQFGRLLSAYLGASFALWIALGFAAMFLQIYRRGRNSGREPFLRDLLAASVRERWDRDRFISLVWPPLLFALLIASFNAFKQMILPTAGFGLDPLFRAADQMLFLGNDPWRATHAIFGSPSLTVALDRGYHGWFLPMSLGLIVCAWMPGATYRLRTQYVLSYIGVWIGIGSIFAYLMPSAGPCYYAHFHGEGGSFEELLRRLGEVETLTGSKLNALSNQAALLRHYGGERLAIGGGISAMPSVHNALSVLFALAAFRLNRTAGWLVSGYAVMIWIGSIHLGWHYALDGIVAALLTIGIWRTCGRIAERFEQPLFGTVVPAVVARGT